MTERFIRILYDKDFERSRFREMLRSFEGYEEMSSGETENRMDKNGFEKDEMNAKLEQIWISAYYTNEVLWRR